MKVIASAKQVVLKTKISNQLFQLMVDSVSDEITYSFIWYFTHSFNYFVLFFAHEFFFFFFFLTTPHSTWDPSSLRLMLSHFSHVRPCATP